MKQRMQKGRIKLVVWLLILATVTSAGISMYLAGQPPEGETCGTREEGNGNGGAG